MSRQASCGPAEARTRSRVARMYLTVAELAASEDLDQARNVAAGNAVLAGIAASDALCCARLNVRHRGQDHQGAMALLRQVNPALVRDLETVLDIKDPAHYGDQFIADNRLSKTLRAATRLVEAAEAVIASAP